jgi:hypothetical protein
LTFTLSLSSKVASTVASSRLHSYCLLYSRSPCSASFGPPRTLHSEAALSTFASTSASLPTPTATNPIVAGIEVSQRWALRQHSCKPLSILSSDSAEMAEVMKEELSIVVMRHRAVLTVSCSAASQQTPSYQRLGTLPPRSSCSIPQLRNCRRAPLKLFELISLKEVNITGLFVTFQE